MLQIAMYNWLILEGISCDVQCNLSDIKDMQMGTIELHLK